jgi:hypothetical protein
MLGRKMVKNWIKNFGISVIFLVFLVPFLSALFFSFFGVGGLR